MVLEALEFACAACSVARRHSALCWSWRELHSVRGLANAGRCTPKNRRRKKKKLRVIALTHRSLSLSPSHPHPLISVPGVCECSDFTAGATCERCQDGYHGNALIGTPVDCQPCPCPARSSCAQIAETGQVVCTNCPRGQTGERWAGRLKWRARRPTANNEPRRQSEVMEGCGVWSP